MDFQYRPFVREEFGLTGFKDMPNHRVTDLSRTQSAGSGSASPTTSRSESSSSKASSPTESIDFRFLNFVHPKDAKDAQTRRSVRSHVTARQHQNTRRAAAELAQRAQSSSSHSNSLSVPREEGSSIPSPAASETEASSPEASSPSPSPTTERAPQLRINPTEVYPSEWHPHLRPVMDHYLNHMAVDVPETSAQAREHLRTRFLALVFTDRASLHALMLTAAAHLAKLNGARAHGINILQLKGMAIQEINRAMTDRGGRATSDQMIAAVGKMATYELMFGQRDTFHTHMTGLQRIVSLRGGLQALGLSGLLERTLLWIDANATVIVGSPLYFPPAAFSSSTGHPRPDKRLFLLGLQGVSPSP